MKCITEIIHQDQSGFAPKRYIKENVHFITDVMEFKQNKEGK